ncbi:iron ABC transporter permease [Periweissella cryptocerci]|uniref:Iron ABC transporter permease n=1 Tax=Periweissella cryptocerci TaxID=2506420 RepID=A0A4P6YSC1_9LACO|nr:iron ABC transporter permease [Periweissella cryptocerci]QBO35530.1 iron ABC transporter permease [Periweissella cryptocerci]
MRKLLMPILIGLLICSALVAIVVGSTHVRLDDLITGQTMAWQIVGQLRIPRILTAIIAGVILGVTGLLLQIVTRNSLVDSSILGLMNGTQFLSLLAGITVPNFFGGKVLAGALLGVVVVVMWRFIVWGRLQNYALILTGIALAMTFAALTELLDSGFNVNVSNLAVVTWSQVWVLGIILLASLIVLVLLSSHLKFYAVSAVQARQLGEDENRTTWFILLVVGLLIGGVTSVIGVVYFVGVILPQLAQLMLPRQSRLKLFVPTALLGALLLLNADTLARTILAPRELSATAILLVICGPVFIGLVLRKVKHA